MIHKHDRRTKAYRRLASPIGYRAVGYRTTSKAIPVCLNGELRDMQSARKEKKG